MGRSRRVRRHAPPTTSSRNHHRDLAKVQPSANRCGCDKATAVKGRTPLVVGESRSKLRLRLDVIEDGTLQNTTNFLDVKQDNLGDNTASKLTC